MRHDNLSSKLDQVVEVLELQKDDSGNYTWGRIQRRWASVDLNTTRNLFSSIGIGARGAAVVLRTAPALTLHNALRWKGQFLFLTSMIVGDNRDCLELQAALVEPTECQADMDQRGGIRFPGILTEKYMKWEQPEPYSVNRLAYVLVTPKPIQLQRGSLVGVSGINYEVQLAHTLDPYKSEYEIVRTEDL